MADPFLTQTPVFERASGVYLYRGAEEFVSFATTDFLGITQDPKVKNTLQVALTKEASVLTGSALNGGMRPIHSRVETRLCLLYTSPSPRD